MESKMLNEKDLQVLALIGEGKSTKEIAFEFGLSPKTIEARIDGAENGASIAAKLGLRGKGRAALIRYAIESGLVKPKDAPKPLKSAIKVLKNSNDLVQSLLEGAGKAAAGTADVLQLNALCNCSDALCRVFVVQMKAEERASKLPWLSD